MNKLLVFLLCTVIFTACKDDEKTEITEKSSLSINFYAKMGDKSIVLEETMGILNGNNLRFSKLGFFISDFSLTTNNGANVTDIFDLNHIDFSNNKTLALAEQGVTINNDQIPVGNYTGIKFSFGVNSDFNAQAPSDFAATHPAGNSDLYWNAWESYIFSTTEGRLDTQGDDNFDKLFVWHTGSNDALRIVNLPIDIEISQDGDATIDITLDLETLLLSEDSVNPLEVDQLHTAESLSSMLMVSDLYQRSFSVK